MGDRARGLDATQLKYLACGAMVIDHIGMLFSPMAAVAGPGDLLFYLFRYVGRLAFPIFAYFTAEGCRKTGNYRRYLLRLGLFGAFTHIVAFGATGGQSGSVIAPFFSQRWGFGSTACCARGVFLPSRPCFPPWPWRSLASSPMWTMVRLAYAPSRLSISAASIRGESSSV